MADIDYFFTLISPYAYLGHRVFLDLAAAHGATVRYRPVMLGKVRELRRLPARPASQGTSGLPLPRTAALARQAQFAA